MITINSIHQDYFLDVSIFDSMRNDLRYENEGLTQLLYNEVNALDEKYNEITLPPLSEFSNLSEWRVFKKQVYQKLDNLNSVISTYLNHAKNVLDVIVSEDDAKYHWDELDDDDYAKRKYSSFDKWYESSSYYDWISDEEQNNWEDFKSENSDLFNHLKFEDYCNSGSQGGIVTYAYEKPLERFKAIIDEIIQGEDKSIEQAKAKHKYEALIYCFEY